MPFNVQAPWEMSIEMSSGCRDVGPEGLISFVVWQTGGGHWAFPTLTQRAAEGILNLIIFNKWLKLWNVVLSSDTDTWNKSDYDSWRIDNFVCNELLLSFQFRKIVHAKQSILTFQITKNILGNSITVGRFLPLQHAYIYPSVLTIRLTTMALKK